MLCLDGKKPSDFLAKYVPVKSQLWSLPMAKLQAAAVPPTEYAPPPLPPSATTSRGGSTSCPTTTTTTEASEPMSMERSMFAATDFASGIIYLYMYIYMYICVCIYRSTLRI